MPYSIVYALAKTFGARREIVIIEEMVLVAATTAGHHALQHGNIELYRSASAATVVI